MEENKEPNILYWDRTMKPGVSKRETYQSLSKVLDKGLAKCSEDACIFMPTKMLPVFVFIEEFKRDDEGNINGSYRCGYYKDIPVYINPWLDSKAPVTLLSRKGCIDILVTE